MISTFLFSILFIATILLQFGQSSVNIAEIEEKIRAHKKMIEESTRKLEQSTRNARMRHAENLKASTERLERIRKESYARAQRSSSQQSLEAALESSKDQVVKPTVEVPSIPVPPIHPSNINSHPATTSNSKSSVSSLSSSGTSSASSVSTSTASSTPAKATTIPNIPANTATTAEEPRKRFGDFYAKREKEAPDSKNPHMQSPKDRLRSTLDSHGVDEAVIQEISRLAATSVPREHIVQHLGTHFPNKKSSELNDIMIAALSYKGTEMPDPSATNNAKKKEVEMSNRRFERSKASFEARKRQRASASSASSDL